MKVRVEGDLTVIELSNKNFIHAGGEGSVYVKGDVAFKIYHKENKVIENQRLLEFKKINLNNVIKPEKIIYNMSGKPIGYTMKALNDVWALTRLFNISFRKKHNISNNCILNLVSKMRSTYAKLHDLGFLVTDGNELNFLVSSDFSNIFFIDVDAFQTPSFTGRSYNESTLDPNVDLNNISFNTESDWYAFAVVACQMLTGTHPFKGIYHGTTHNFAKNDIPSRIKARISIFNNDVKIARPTMSLEDLPRNYHYWFSEIFESRARPIPPIKFESITSKSSVTFAASQSLKTLKIRSFSENIISYYNNGQSNGYKTNNFFYYGEEKKQYNNPSTEMIFLPMSNTPVLIKHEGGRIVLFDTSSKISYEQDCDLISICICDNRVYGITNSNLLEFSFKVVMGKIRIVSESIEEIISGTLRFFDGIFTESLMGGLHVSIPIENGACAKIHIKELDGKKILNAKHNNQIMVVVWYDNGNYIRCIYKFDNQYRNYKTVDKSIVDELDINFTVLNQGIAILMSEPGVIKIFSNNYSQDAINEIKDTSINPNIKFVASGSKLNGILDKTIYSLSMC